MRRNQKANAILNSPIVRSFIKPVRSILPSSSSSLAKPSHFPSTSTSTSSTGLGKATGGNPYLSHPDTDGDVEEERSAEELEKRREDGPWMIPTQPSEGIVVVGGSADAKGKKRGREGEAEEAEGEEVVEYDAVAGTRFGVPVRYQEGVNLPEELAKYWAQRYRLFSEFDQGCEMDREGWYSVTPENIAAQIAERCRCGTIVDAFCGVGGNAIQFAFTCERVIALDTSPVRLACARRNAEIYGVADRITFLLTDYVQWSKDYAARDARGEVKEEEKVEVIFLSPPWGGIDYQTAGTPSSAAATAPPPKKKPRHSLLSAFDEVPSTPTPSLPPPSSSSAESTTPPPAAYPLSALAPLHGATLFSLSRAITPNIAYYLPRNQDLLELAALPDVAPWAGRPGAGEGRRERVEVEEEWMGWKLKAVTAYYGELAVEEEEEGDGKEEEEA